MIIFKNINIYILTETGPVVLEKKIFQNRHAYSFTRTVLLFSPWKRAWLFFKKTLEFPLPKDALCQVWLKLVQWFIRRIQKCENFTITTMDKF